MRLTSFTQWLFAIVLIGTPLVFMPDLFLTFELPKAVFFRGLIEVIFLLCVVGIFFQEKFSFPRIPKIFWWMFFLFVLSFVVATVFSVAPEMSFWGSYYRQQGLFMNLHYWLFFALILVFFDKTTVGFLIRSLMLAGFFVAVLGVFQKFFPFLSDFWDIDAFLGRIFSTLGHPNYLAAFLTLVLPLYCVEIFQKRGRTFWTFGALMLLIALVLTLSRAAFLGFVFSIWIFALLVIWRRGFRKIFAACVITPFALVAIILFLAQAFPSAPLLNRFTMHGENIRSVETRLVMWPAVISQIADRPFFGFGPETFAMTFQKYAPKALLRLEHFEYIADRAHNEFLDTAASIGIIGLLFYGLFLFVLLRIAFKSQNLYSVAAGCGILALLITNQFGFSTTVHFTVFWLLAAIILLLNFEKREYAVTFFRSAKLSFSLLTAAGLVFVFVLLPLHVRTITADKAFRRVQDGSYSGDFLSSFIFLDQAHAMNPHQSFYAFSGAKMILNALDQFSPFIQKLLDDAGKFTNFRDAEYFILHGKFLNMQKSFSQANSNFEKAHQLAPNMPRLVLEWGKNLSDAGKYREAVSKYEEYIALAPPYWSWKDRDDLTDEQKNQRRIFYKLNPGFDQVFDLIVEAEKHD